MIACVILLGRVAIASGLAATVTTESGHGAVDEAPSHEPDPQKQAAAAVQQGATAFEQGDYRSALAKFEVASRLRPAAKLHYNIAVCHHRLMLQADDANTRAYHADQAIVGYNAYLRASPEAADRTDVKGIIEDLGGSVARPRLKDDIFATHSASTRDEGETTSATSEHDRLDSPTGQPDGARDDGDQSEDNIGSSESALLGTSSSPEPNAPAVDSTHTPQAAAVPLARRVELQVALLLGATPTLQSERIEGEGTGSFATSVLGFVGRSLAVGGSLSVYAGGNNTPDQLVLTGAHMALSTQYAHNIGARQRFRLAGGADLGLARQVVRARVSAAAPVCTSHQGENAIVGARHGFVGALRLSAGVLLGRRRRHTVAVHVFPAAATYGRGSNPHADAVCANDTRPLDALGLTAGSVFIWAGAGYSVGF